MSKSPLCRHCALHHDGKDTEGNTNAALQAAAQKLKDIGVTVAVLGIGTGIPQATLAAIASEVSGQELIFGGSGTGFNDIEALLRDAISLVGAILASSSCFKNTQLPWTMGRCFQAMCFCHNGAFATMVCMSCYKAPL
jgi:hypothetical protein